MCDADGAELGPCECAAEMDAAIDLDGGADAGVIPMEDSGADAGLSDSCVSGPVTSCFDGCEAVNEGGGCSPPPGFAPGATCEDGLCVGEPCECSTGPCCDGCLFRPASYECASEVIYESRCSSPSAACPGSWDRITEDVGNVFCPGDGADCEGAVEHVRSTSRACSFCVEEGGVRCTDGCS